MYRFTLENYLQRPLVIFLFTSQCTPSIARRRITLQTRSKIKTFFTFQVTLVCAAKSSYQKLGNVIN